MCLPYMRERAESMSNIILDNTPNGLILTNDQFEIIQFNQAATKLLNLDNACLGMPIDAFLNLDELGKIRETGKAIMGQRCKTAIYDVLVEQSVVPVPDHDYLFLLIGHFRRGRKHEGHGQNAQGNHGHGAAGH